jgi:hypothetical protein
VLEGPTVAARRLALLALSAFVAGACGSEDAQEAPDVLDEVPEDLADLVDPGDAPDAPGGSCDADRLQWGLGGGLMLPGTDCLSCHRVGGSADDSVYSVAGTVFVDATCPEGVERAEVRVFDAGGREITLLTNAVGNFYTDEVLTPPLRTSVVVGGVETVMRTPFTNGSCAACHSEGSRLGFVYGGR